LHGHRRAAPQVQRMPSDLIDPALIMLDHAA
jgi:hypothetical protein